MPIYHPIKEWDLKFAEMAVKEIPNGFVSTVIVGERRKGKSVYSLKNGAKLTYSLEGLADEECWKKALESVVFGPEDLSDRIFHNNEKDVVSPYWILDDATVHFNPILFFINPYLYSLLQGIFDTIGTAVNVLMLTCPKKQRLMKGLKTYDDITTHIIKAREGGYERIARGILWFTMPDDKQRYRKLFEDHFSCYAPDFIYKPYVEKRKKYLSEINAILRAYKDKLDVEKHRKMLSLNENIMATRRLIEQSDKEIEQVEEEGDGTC